MRSITRRRISVGIGENNASDGPKCLSQNGRTSVQTSIQCFMPKAGDEEEKEIRFEFEDETIARAGIMALEVK